MPSINLAVIGKGTVGSALLRQLSDKDLHPKLIAGKNAYIKELQGFQGDALHKISESGFESFEPISHASEDDLEKAFADLGSNLIIADVTAADGERHKRWREAGHHIVTANKKPLSDTLGLFNDLVQDDGPQYRHEATVGAGLPLISTIESLHATGDKVTRFSGMLSGTMGAIFSACDGGMSFAEAVKQAKENGFTEPDPRDDLSGMDIARKALILARLMGHELEIEDLRIESLVPVALSHHSIDDFMLNLEREAGEISQKLKDAKENGHVLRYLAEGDEMSVRIGLVEVPSSHPAFGLSGPENLIVLHSNRYHDIPITLRGPGAGAEVTAAGVLSDIIHISRSL